MVDLILTKTRIQAGVWEGVLTGADEAPELAVTHLEKRLRDVSVTRQDDRKARFLVRIPIPPDLLTDGVQTFLITNANTGEKLNSFAIVTGQPVDDDLRGELDLLRAELDMLKKAFRRHCLETT